MPARLFFVALSALLVSCSSPPDGSVPLDERHPLSEEYHLAPVLADGSISPDWGITNPDAGAIPDTLGYPPMTAAGWLAEVERASEDGRRDTLRANVWVRIVGFHLCPPCPPRAECEPCGPGTVVGVDETAAGQATARFEIGPEIRVHDLRAGLMGVVSAEAVPLGDRTARVVFRGFTERSR